MNLLYLIIPYYSFISLLRTFIHRLIYISVWICENVAKEISSTF